MQDAIVFKKKWSVYIEILWNGLEVFLILSLSIWTAVEVAVQNTVLISLLTPWHWKGRASSKFIQSSKTWSPDTLLKKTCDHNWTKQNNEQKIVFSDLELWTSKPSRNSNFSPVLKSKGSSIHWPMKTPHQLENTLWNPINSFKQPSFAILSESQICHSILQ